MNDASKVRKKKRRSPAMAAVLVALVIMMVLITTLAMFTSRDLITNRFESGKLDIVLLEPNWKPSQAAYVQPGDSIPKDPQVKNADETDAYVFLKVTVPYVELKLDNADGTKNSTTNTIVPLYKFVTGTQSDPNTDQFTQTVNSAWYLMQDKSGADTENKTYTYLYGYKGTNGADALAVLAPDSTTEPLFDSLKVSNFNEGSALVPAGSYSVNVEAYAIQAKYLANGNDTTNIPSTVWDKIMNN